MATFTGYLRARSDDELVALLRLRPDLAAPAPSTLSSLAVRATSRSSLDRALASVDAGVLQVLEAVVALDESGPVSSAQLVRAVAGVDDPVGAAAVEQALRSAQARALVFPEEPSPDAPLHPSPGLPEALGPYPAGLAPVDHHRAVHPPTDPDVVRALLDEAPAGARQVLDALTWGPPVGLSPSPGSPSATAVSWLVRRGLLVPGDNRHVLLPRAVALALRDGRTHRRPAAAPPVPTEAAVRPPALVAAESASAGERVARLVARLTRSWEQSPPPVLRAGGLGVRELKRTAAALELDEGEAAFVVELAGAAGFVADDGEEVPSFVPTVAVDDWWSLDLAGRWAALARTWLTSPRAAWLVGTRDERGALRGALDPELVRAWAPRLRATVLGALAEVAPGTALTAAQVLDVLRWRTPRSVPPLNAVDAVLLEAGRLGVLGAGALSDAGRALITGGDPAEALGAALPAAVDEVLLQGDLTGIVPGRPSAALEDLLDRTARVESRGGAVTVRFTADSVRAALDAGSTADALLAELAEHSRGAVPQPLEYLVRDAARRHGRLRAGSASSYLRADDPALLAGLVEDARFTGLGLVALAPTVLVAQAGTRELVEALRAAGLAPVAEGPDGQVLHLMPEVRRVGRRGAAAARRRAADAAAVVGPQEAQPTERLAALVPRLRRADEDQVPAVPTPVAPGRQPQRAGSGTADPAGALVLLREAAAERTPVWVELVGPQGLTEKRLLRPVLVEGGRVRAVDPAREAELTIAVHRIASVTREEESP
ncbi:helicase-associated domain-containing protein [Cellulomonas sp. URHB0016]